MRLPRVRFTVRWMMIAVAVVALLLGGVKPGRQLLYCLREANRCVSDRAAYLAEIKRIESRAAKYGITLQEIERREKGFWCGTDTLGSYRRGLEKAIQDERAYRRAAFRPWEPVPHSFESVDVQSLKRLLAPRVDQAALTENNP